LISFCHTIAGSKPTSCREENFRVGGGFEDEMSIWAFKSELSFFIYGFQEFRSLSSRDQLDQKSKNTGIPLLFHIGNRIGSFKRNFFSKIMNKKPLSWMDTYFFSSEF